MNRIIRMLAAAVLLCGLTGCAKKSTADGITADDLIEQIITYHGCYGEQADDKVNSLLAELKKKDRRQGALWTDIMEYWDYVNTEMPVNPNRLPDGLPDTDELCIVVLGFQLNPDGTMKDELIERFNWICAQSPASAKFMYENGTMYGYKESEGIRSALKHGTLAIGQIGLAETLQILIGCDQTEERGMVLAKQIEQLFKDKCAEYKEHYKLNFGVYYTPAENLCFTAFKKFKKKYGEIKNVTYSDIEGKEDSDVKDHREFFTNSMHVPVWKKMDPFEKIDIESQLTGYSSAGCITYVELDDRTQNNLKALEQIVDYAMEKDIPYFAINVPADTCTCCGYQGSIDNECPVCGARDTPGKKVIQRLRRVTGYLTGDFETAFNLGKQDEVKHRYKHSESLVDWNNTSDQEA